MDADDQEVVLDTIRRVERDTALALFKAYCDVVAGVSSVVSPIENEIRGLARLRVRSANVEEGTVVK